MSTTKQTSDIVASPYTPTEHAILCHWLGLLPPEGVPDIHSLPILAPGDGDDVDVGEGYGGGIDTETGIQLQQGFFEIDLQLAVSNAVARLTLGAVQHRLPQWVCFRGDAVCHGRQYDDPEILQGREVVALPQFLFEINWADSAPGFSWPEAYYVTCLPGYDVYVVTLSVDSPETYGYCDLVIDRFEPCDDIISAARAAVRDWWQVLLDSYDQKVWAYLFSEGLVDDAEAKALACEVWRDVIVVPDDHRQKA